MIRASAAAVAPLVLSLLALSPPSIGQCDGEWDRSFVLPGTNGLVRAVAMHDDGTGPALWVGGTFDQIGEFCGARDIACWDGRAWSAVPEGPSGVRVFASFDSGSGPELYVGGGFYDVGGRPGTRGIARWTSSGWTDVAGGTDGSVHALAVLDDGSGPALYVGGSFSAVGGGLPAGRVARWDGTSWSQLGGGVGSFRVIALAGLDDGNGPAIYAATDDLVDEVLRWDGTTWTALGGSLGGVEALCAFDDGTGARLYAGGDFWQLGQPRPRVLRLDGTGWTPVGPILPGLGPVRALLPFDDGSGPALYATGALQGAGRPGVARWDGASWTPLDHGAGDALTGGYALGLYDDGGGPELVVGGDFETAGSVGASDVALWDGRAWSAFASGQGADHPVHRLEVVDLGSGPELLAVGSFYGIGGVAARGVARFDGTTWSGFNSGPPAMLPFFSVAVYDDGAGPALFVDRFRWDGSWSAIPGLSGFVATLEVFDGAGGPRLYIGGRDLRFHNTALGALASWDGMSLSPVGGGILGQYQTVHALEMYDDGSGSALFVGGNFQGAAGVPDRIARWDGVQWSDVGGGVDGGTVRALETYDLGEGPRLFVGGEHLSSAGGIATHNLASWDGAGWSDVGGGVAGRVRSLHGYDLGDGPRLWVGGDFDEVGPAGNEVPASYLASWDGGVWSTLDGGLMGGSTVAVGVHALRGFDAGEGPTLWAGGDFSEADGAPAYHLARWRPGSGCALSYCSGKTNSLGCVPFVTSTGVPSATSTAPFRLLANDVQPSATMVVLYGSKKSNLSFHGGKLCIKVPITRLPHKAAKPLGTPPCSGVVARDFNARIQGGADPALTAGATVFAQWRGRDVADPAGFGDTLTDAVRFTIQP